MANHRLALRRIRLVVRTQGSQLWNRGSIPLCANPFINSSSFYKDKQDEQGNKMTVNCFKSCVSQPILAKFFKLNSNRSGYNFFGRGRKYFVFEPVNLDASFREHS